jgi:hypothetical protein
MQGSRNGDSLVNAFPKQQSTSVLSQVDSLYDVRDQGVGQVLAAQPDLIPTLLDVAHTVPRFFGRDARLTLESVIDPEENATEPELYAVIATSMPPKQALERLNAFDADWWLERSRRFGPRLTVTVD